MEEFSRKMFEEAFSKLEETYGVEFSEEFKKAVLTIDETFDKLEDWQKVRAYLIAVSVLPVFGILRMSYLRNRDIKDDRERIRKIASEMYMHLASWLEYFLVSFNQGIATMLQRYLETL